MEKKRFGGRILILLMAALFMWVSCEGPAGPVGPQGEQGFPGSTGIITDPNVVNVIDIYSFNDFHGSVDKSASTSNPGADRFTAIAQKLLSNNPNSVLLAAGDNYQGSALSNHFSGEPVSDMMKYLGVKLSSVGNHEFDWGSDKINKFATDGAVTFLAANILVAGTDNYPAFCKPYEIITIGGRRIGFIGLTTLYTPSIVKAEYVAGLDFRAPDQWLVEMIADLRTTEKCDLVIGLTHMGANQNPTFTGTVTGEAADLAIGFGSTFDAIITGHSHTTVAGYAVPGGVPLVQGYYNGRGLARLNIQYKVTNGVASRDILPIAYTQNNMNFSDILPGATSATLGSSYANPSITGVVNEEIKTVIDSYNTTAGPVFDEILGKYGIAITSRDEQAAWANQVVFDYIQRNTPASDNYILFQNAGGWRDTSPYDRKPTDDVTYRYLCTLMPFDNEIFLLEMKGSDILYMLGLPVGNSNQPPFLISAAVVTGAFNDGSIWRLGSPSSPGAAIEAGTTYKVSCNDFMLTGGDNFPFPGATVQGHTSEKFVEPVNMGTPLRDAMVNELRWRATH
jgi:2',3'-cyclic-nucleotide 2'-phosphodiesterase (5'-nucleotidase family)